MHKLVVVAGATLFLVLFGMENSEHVPISFIIGNPANVRLVFLLCIAAACGFLFAYVRGLTREIRLKRQIRKLVGMSKAALVNVPDAQVQGGFDE